MRLFAFRSKLLACCPLSWEIEMKKGLFRYVESQGAKSKGADDMEFKSALRWEVSDLK